MSEPVGDGVPTGWVVVVVDVVDVVVEAVVEVGGGSVVVVVDVDVLVVLVAVVVVDQRPCDRRGLYRRRAEATGTEIASITVTAVRTTTIVRSLRLILFPLSCGWDTSAAGPERHSGSHAGAPGRPLRHARRRRRPGAGLEPPAGRGPNVLGHGKPCECDEAAFSG